MKYNLYVIFVFTLCFAQKEITVRSQSTIEFEVNTVDVRIKTSADGINLETVNQDNYNISLSILNLLNEYGYNYKDIITESSSASKARYSLRDKKEPNYHASTEYRITLEDLKLYDQLKSDLIKNGAISVSYSPKTSDIEMYRKQAFKKAILDAENKAKMIAAGFGYKKISFLKAVSGGYSYKDYVVKEINSVKGDHVFTTSTNAISISPIESSITTINESVSVDILVEFSVDH